MYDDLSLRTLYSAADLLVIPLRQNNLPNTGVEGHACGTSMVALNTGGLLDIVDHKRTAILAEAFDMVDLAHGIKWVLANAETAALPKNAREHASAKFSYPVVARKYKKIYEAIEEK